MSIVVLALAFLVGSIPFSWLLVWGLKGIDLRTVGSGNPGATNAMRVVGPFWGGLGMVLDVGKGWVGAGWLPALYPFLSKIPLTGEGEVIPWLPAVCGCCAILGNVFCPFLRFKGGKAVATAGGVFLALDWISTLLTALLFFFLLRKAKKTSIASLVAALLLPILVTIHALANDRFSPDSSVVWLVWGAAFLVVLRHKENIRRLWAGEETTFTQG
jgi:glycerol-3-phosphate acyltransferase PlsY